MYGIGYLSIQGNAPMKLPVRVTKDVTGVLTPSFAGEGTAWITIRNNNVDPKTAVINFEGMDQALVSFDSLGMKGIQYTPLNPMHNSIIASSIENIVYHMNENMLG